MKVPEEPTDTFSTTDSSGGCSHFLAGHRTRHMEVQGGGGEVGGGEGWGRLLAVRGAQLRAASDVFT